MEQTIKKHKRLELFLNKKRFKGINVGSLLAEVFIINSYHQLDIKFFRTIMVLIKYILTMFVSKKVKNINSTFIFTKLHNKFHYNTLMDDLLLHYLSRSTIICNENSFKPQLVSIYPIYTRSLHTSRTINNSLSDILKILSVSFAVMWVLIKNRKRLEVSKNEIIFFVTTLLIQLRRVSYWDRYFNKSSSKPKIIVTEHDRSTISSSLILTAKKHNIFTITLTHGVITAFCNVPILANQVFCWGKSQKDLLVSLGIEAHRISLTGNPMFKVINKKNFSELTRSNNFTFCLAISPDGEKLNRLLIEKFVLTIEKFDQVRGVIKLHPSLNKESFVWVDAISTKVTFLDSLEVINNELFEKIDILLVHSSGIANEALVAGIPVVIILPTNSSILNEVQIELTQQAGCQLAKDENQLMIIFKKIISDPIKYKIDANKRSKKYLKDLLEATGEESVKAMIAEIDRLTGTK
jgi:hypothetical protein